MLDRAAYRLRARSAPGLPVDRMVIGQTPEAAAALLPRLFNLCRTAQGIAARAAFGLPAEADWQQALIAEILREHVVKLCIKWPVALSQPQVVMPRNWQSDATGLRRAIFGPSGQVPDDLARWIAEGQGAAPLFGVLSELFRPGEGTRAALPLATRDGVFDHEPIENSVAARHISHPLLRAVEAGWGRGPLWSAVAVLIDVDALLRGSVPPLDVTSGQALVPAARGLYAIRATVENDRVTEFSRVTPTDHLLAPGGMLEQALDSLPQARDEALAPVVLSLMDPCFPISLERVDA